MTMMLFLVALVIILIALDPLAMRPRKALKDVLNAGVSKFNASYFNATSASTGIPCFSLFSGKCVVFDGKNIPGFSCVPIGQLGVSTTKDTNKSGDKQWAFSTGLAYQWAHHGNKAELLTPSHPSMEAKQIDGTKIHGKYVCAELCGNGGYDTWVYVRAGGYTMPPGSPAMAEKYTCALLKTDIEGTRTPLTPGGMNKARVFGCDPYAKASVLAQCVEAGRISRANGWTSTHLIPALEGMVGYSGQAEAEAEAAPTRPS